MPKVPKAPPERITLSHPSGNFTVTVSPARAEQFRARGYIGAGAEPTPIRKRTTKPPEA
jgi:hypothetical protein